MEATFEMVGKTLKGLEAVLADELRELGALNVEPGHRMVKFEGDLEMLYKANLCCRTALRILKPFYHFKAEDHEMLYEMVKEYDWESILTLDDTFAISTVSNSDEFTHSHFVTYKVKDAIVDWFQDRYGRGKRPGVRLSDADVLINVHIAGDEVTLSLDSSGESLHKRGYRHDSTEAPISEVLAAGIILMSGYRGQVPFVDPMCGSGTFLIEAALIAANIAPGIFRSGFAFEHWKDFDQELFDRLYNDESQERVPQYKIYGADISAAAVATATKNAKAAGLAKYIDIQRRALVSWTEADVPQPAGILVTNPPYGRRISAPDMEGLYSQLGTTLKTLFRGYHAWVISSTDEFFRCIGLAPSQKVSLLNGGIECELREYVMFEGNKKDFLASGGKLKEKNPESERKPRADRGDRMPRFPREDGERKPRFERDGERKPRFERDGDRKPRFPREDGERKPRFPREDGERKPRFPREDGERRPRFERDGERPRRYFDKGDPENPAAARRNPDMLRSVTGQMPSLPPTDGVIMRSRGWKKKK